MAHHPMLFSFFSLFTYVLLQDPSAAKQVCQGLLPIHAESPVATGYWCYCCSFPVPVLVSSYCKVDKYYPFEESRLKPTTAKTTSPGTGGGARGGRGGRGYSTPQFPMTPTLDQDGLASCLLPGGPAGLFRLRRHVDSLPARRPAELDVLVALVVVVVAVSGLSLACANSVLCKKEREKKKLDPFISQHSPPLIFLPDTSELPHVLPLLILSVPPSN